MCPPKKRCNTRRPRCLSGNVRNDQESSDVRWRRHGTADSGAAVIDRRLLGQIAKGDLRAFDSFYSRHSATAYGLALRIVRDPRLAEDALQEAFLDIWRNAARFDACRGGAMTWLLTLVHRRAVDVVRRQDRHRCEQLDAPDEEFDDPGFAAADSSPETIRALVAALPKRDRELLVWAHYEGLTQTEIADRAGIPLGTIKSRMFNAYKTLRPRFLTAALQE